MTNDIPSPDAVGRAAASSRETHRGIPAWVWVVIAALVIVVVPAVGCGACGLGAALAAQQPPTSVALTPSVGLIRIEGPIIPGESSGLGGHVAASDTIVRLIERAGSDANIKALVLRVDSPGGGVVASDEIHHALTQLDKPIVVSMGSVAASGGYLISAAADYVYTTPYTLTGSIGVISQFVTVEDLLNKFGVEVVVITAGDAKDFGSFHRDMTEEERAYWDSLLEETRGATCRLRTCGRWLTGALSWGSRQSSLGLSMKPDTSTMPLPRQAN